MNSKVDCKVNIDQKKKTFFFKPPLIQSTLPHGPTSSSQSNGGGRTVF